MKSQKVLEIIKESEKKSLEKCKDLSMAQFSYDEVLDLIKISNREIGVDLTNNLSVGIILLDYLEDNVRLIDRGRNFYPDEIVGIIEITELNSQKEILEMVKKFKIEHK